MISEYIYLGTTINYNGSFHKAIEKQISQGRHAFYSLTAMARRLHFPIDLQIKLFRKFFLPILL